MRDRREQGDVGEREPGRAARRVLQRRAPLGAAGEQRGDAFRRFRQSAQIGDLVVLDDADAGVATVCKASDLHGRTVYNL